MAVRDIVHIPNSILKKTSSPLSVFGEESSSLARDLIDTMRAHPHCVGLAAPQIGVDLRAFVVDVSGHPKAQTSHGEVVLLNPNILESYEPEVAREGCMSVPDLTGDVARATILVVRGVTPDGERTTIEVRGFEARAFQHEIDHLDGLLFLDRVQSHHGVFHRKTYR